MVKITELAAQKVKVMQKEQNMEDAFLRVYLVGEIKGVPYFGFILEESKDEDDILVVEFGISIITDIELINTLEGTTIDYSESNNGGRFEIRKERMEHAEGCGESCRSCGGSCQSCTDIQR